MKINAITISQPKTYFSHNNSFKLNNISFGNINQMQSEFSTPKFETETQGLGEKTANYVFSEAKRLNGELFKEKTKAYCNLRYVSEGLSGWHHKDAFEKIKDSDEKLCKINGLFFVSTPIKNKPESTVITRLADAARVVFNEEGIVEEIMQGEYLMRTDAYYSKKGTGIPFMTCRGYSNIDNTPKAKEVYYFEPHNQVFKDFKIENGKKLFKERFKFSQFGNVCRMDEFQNSEFKLTFNSLEGRYFYTQTNW